MGAPTNFNLVICLNNMVLEKSCLNLHIIALSIIGIINNVHGQTIVREACVAGDPMYRSFDGKRFDFQGLCCYLLTKPLVPQPGKEWTVTACNEQVEGQMRSVPASVKVEAFGHVILMKQGGYIKVDGYADDQQIGTNGQMYVANDEIKITKEQGPHVPIVKIRIKSLFLEVDYESLRGGRHKLTVRLVGTAMELGPYIGTMSGLFGNNNNNQDDDFYNPEKPGEVFNDVFAFAHSFKIGDTCKAEDE